MSDGDLLAGLPGEALMRAGIADLAAGRRTWAACLVDVARTRLSRAGLIPASAPPASQTAELELYALLRGEGGDAYSRYNALIRELVSFESALDRRLHSRTTNR
jgi:hypothetical protein